MTNSPLPALPLVVICVSDWSGFPKLGAPPGDKNQDDKGDVFLFGDMGIGEGDSLSFFRTDIAVRPLLFICSIFSPQYDSYVLIVMFY